jgi:hypothetical protein
MSNFLKNLPANLSLKVDGRVEILAVAALGFFCYQSLPSPNSGS